MKCPFKKIITYYDGLGDRTTKSEAYRSEETFGECEKECRAYFGNKDDQTICLRINEKK